MPKSRPVVITFSILAGLQVLTGAAALGDVIGDKAFGMAALVVAAIQVGMTFYVQNAVVPVSEVAAYQSSQGEVVAGPASGVTNGKTVDVVKTEPPASEGEATPRFNELGQIDVIQLLVITFVVLAVLFVLTKMF